MKSMYSTSSGPIPLATILGTAAVTSFKVANGASTVAANAGRGALTREDRVHETVRPRGLIELVELDTRLHHGDVVVEIDLDDVVHALERHDDATVDGDAGARESRARTACRERDAGLGGELDHPRHFRRRPRPHDREGALRDRG